MLNAEKEGVGVERGRAADVQWDLFFSICNPKKVILDKGSSISCCIPVTDDTEVTA